MKQYFKVSFFCTFSLEYFETSVAALSLQSVMQFFGE